jgi:hypothetical protein
MDSDCDGGIRLTKQTIGVTAKVTPAVHRALKAVALQMSEGERKREVTSLRCLIGQFIEAFLREGWDDWFQGISFDEYCRKIRADERVDLKRYRFLKAPALEQRSEGDRLPRVRGGASSLPSAR